MKYKLGKKNKRTGLYRIVALQNISTINVKAGDEGGLIEKESNLSQEGNAWVYRNAQVYGFAYLR